MHTYQMGYEVLSAVDHYGNELNTETKRKLMQRCIMAPRFLREMLEGDACTICGMMELPQTGKYRVDVIDVWEMTRKNVLEEVNGSVQVPLPGKTGMAVLAVKTGE